MGKKEKRYQYQSFDDDYYKYASVHERAASYNATEDEGFLGYEETTVDPGSWLLITTTIFCFGVMLVLVPLLVLQKVKKRSRKKKQRRKKIIPSSSGGGMDLNEPLAASEATTPATFAKKNRLWSSIFSWDDETKKILSLALPYTISGLTSSTMSNICLGLIGHYVGTRAVAAYALVQIMLGLTGGILYGPISACTTVCAHAVGASNPNLAGQYIQIAIGIYLLSSIPIIFFWWTFMEDVIMYIEWGDPETAALAQDFTRVYIWTYVLGGVSTSLWRLLEVAGHVVEGTIVSIFWGVVNVIVTCCMIFGRPNKNTTLFEVGVAYVITSALFVGFTYGYADYKGWIKPFKSGLFGTNALFENRKALKQLLKQGVPLGLGSLLADAEWTVLTFFASALGPAEVAAWAILASIWDIFYKVTTGISDAGEMRVAHYFGRDEPELARLAGYKALLLSMSVASLVSILFFFLQNSIPKWFTVDETLQGMLREVVPYVGVGNLTMQFGMTSWSLIGAQGKYKIATWISAICDWGISVPLAAFFCFVMGYDLQGLTAAVVIGYVVTGAALSYVLLGTNWDKVAEKIHRETNNHRATTSTMDDDDNDVVVLPTGGIDDNDTNNNEEAKAAAIAALQDDKAENATYAALRGRKSEAARTVATGNIRLVVLPAGVSAGLQLQWDDMANGVVVLWVKPWSQLFNQVVPGDVVLSLDGQSLSGLSVMDARLHVLNVADMLKDPAEHDRTLVVISPVGTSNLADAFTNGTFRHDQNLDLEDFSETSSSTASTDDDDSGEDDDDDDDDEEEEEEEDDDDIDQLEPYSPPSGESEKGYPLYEI